MIHSRYFDTRQIYIIHSMMKTGTTSVGKALIDLDIDQKEHGWKPDLGEKFKERFNIVNKLLAPYMYYSKVPLEIKESVRILLLGLVKECNNFFIFSDFPIGHIRLNPFAKKMIFPNAKFIWIDRSFDAWLKSVKKWQLNHIDAFPKAVSAWSDENEKDTQENLIAQYERNKLLLKNLKEEFNNDVLFYDLSDGWKALCEFSNKDVPNEPFPFINVSK